MKGLRDAISKKAVEMIRAYATSIHIMDIEDFDSLWNVMPILAAEKIATHIVQCAGSLTSCMKPGELIHFVEVIGLEYKEDISSVLRQHGTTWDDLVQFQRDIKRVLGMCEDALECLDCGTGVNDVEFLGMNEKSLHKNISILQECFEKCDRHIAILRQHEKNAQWNGIIAFLAYSETPSYIRSVREFLHLIYPDDSQWGCNTSQALSTMKKEGIANNPQQGFWELTEQVPSSC